MPVSRLILVTAVVLAGLGLWMWWRSDAHGTGRVSPLPGLQSGYTGPIDLLLRRPDERFELPGPIVPEPRVEWGEHGGPGWAGEHELPKLPDGTPYVETNQPVAELRLHAPLPADRTIELDLWCARRAAATPSRLTVRLNGRALKGEHELPDHPATLRLEAPKELWWLGENALELEVPVLEPEQRTGPLRWDVLALARASWGPEQRVLYDVQAARYELAPSTGLRYTVEARGAARLEVRAVADGPGELRVRLDMMDPRTGRFLSDDGPEEIVVEVKDAIERFLPLPETDAVTVIDLVWSPEREHDLRLEHLSVTESEAHPRPNVVLVSIDTLSARHMSVHGYERPTTPELERFARDAVVFERCVANAPWTLPSYLSALTGLYPQSHFVEVEHSPGIEITSHSYWQAARSRWTLAEAFRARGYQTAASVDTDWLSPRFHVDQGFDLYDVGPAAHPFSDPSKGIRLILERFGPWLDEMRSEEAPFFAFIHALDAHGPYWPEPPYLNAFQESVPREKRPTPAGSAPQTFGAIPTWMAYTLCPPELRDTADTWGIPRRLPLEEIVARYDETILKTDASLGELFEMLRDRGLYEDSVIVVTADHGESFAHGMYSHGVLWEDVVHVPLLIKLPDSAYRGTRVSTSVQLVDLYPTLLELSGAGPPRDYLHGRSLLPLIDAADSETPPSSPHLTFSEGGHIDQAMIEVGGWKLIETRPGNEAGVAALLTHPRTPREWLERHVPGLGDPPVLTEELRDAIQARPDFPPRFEELKQELAGPYYELYDLRNDPREQNDVAAEHPERVAELRRRLEAERERARAAQADARPERAPRPLNEEARARLRKLGYGGDEGG